MCYTIIFCFQFVYPTKEVSLLDQQQNQRQSQKKVLWITPILQLLYRSLWGAPTDVGASVSHFFQVLLYTVRSKYSITRYIRLARYNSSFCTVHLLCSSLRWLTAGLNTFLTFLSFVLFSEEAPKQHHLHVVGFQGCI